MKKQNKTLNYFYGLLAELFIIILLYRKKYYVIKWRYKNPLSEIDIIAKNIKLKEMIFIEVKYRTNKTNHKETISIAKQQKICKAAEIFLSESYPKYIGYFLRFDACFINSEFKINYIRNAWQSL